MSKPFSKSKARAVALLKDDGVPRYRVAGSVLEVMLPYSTAYDEVFRLAGGTLQPGLTPDSKPMRVFTPEAVRRITALNVLHTVHARRVWESEQAAAKLRQAAAPTESGIVGVASVAPAATVPA